VRNRVTYAVVTLLGLALMAFLLWQVNDPIRSARNDFLPLYVAGKLAGTGDLYDSHAYYAFMIQRFAARNASLRFTRLPFYAALLWPLSLLPYKTAYAAWWLLRIASLGGFVALWRIPSRADAVLFTVLSLPVFASLAAGQDSILLLLFIAVAFRCWQNGNDYNAGLALSLCAIKFHLFVLLPLLFWRQRLGRMAAGFGSGAAALLAVSFAVEGWRWPFDYFAVLTDGRVHPSADSMPNLHGLFAGLPHGVYLEALASAAVVAAAWLTLRTVSFPSGFALTLLGGLLLSFHSYLMDAAILLPALLIVVAGTTRRSLKIAGTLLLSPPAALLLVSHPPWSYLTQAGLAVFFFATVLDLWSAGRRVVEMREPQPQSLPGSADPQVSLNHSPM
jgi:Glycosyltransferase family 87